LFGAVSQDKRIYMHSSKARNVPKRTVKDAAFKSKALLCSNCNNTLSQPYDKAWEKLSASLRNHGSLKPRRFVKLNKIFPQHRKRMLDVHLYFVKLFGCHIVENRIPIDIGSFAEAVLNGTAHPRVFIAIGPTTFSEGKKIAGWSEIHGAQTDDGRCIFAQWFYHVDNVAVLVMYAEPGPRWARLSQAWHPNTQGRLLQLASFEES
jgi:hypothetical protein